jgi:hypothetical protein
MTADGLVTFLDPTCFDVPPEGPDADSEECSGLRGGHVGRAVLCRAVRHTGTIGQTVIVCQGTPYY